MKTLMAWIINHTKAGKVIKATQEAVEGKKQMLASLATALSATLLIVKNFGEQGTPYLLNLPHTPEFLAASGGWIALFNAYKGEKTRNEIAALHETMKAQLPPPVAPDAPPQAS